MSQVAGPISSLDRPTTRERHGSLAHLCWTSTQNALRPGRSLCCGPLPDALSAGLAIAAQGVFAVLVLERGGVDPRRSCAEGQPDRCWPSGQQDG